MKCISAFSTSALALLILLAGCDVSTLSDDIEDALKVSIVIPPIETSGTLQILDAQTGESINQRVSVEFAGPNGDLVVDQFLFEPIPVTTTESGVVTFALPDGLTYSATDPYRITARIISDGYLLAQLNFAIPAKGEYEVEANLVRISNPPAGVAVVSQPSGTTDNSGTTQTATTVSATDNTTGSTATVSMPSGTQVTSSTGQPLTGGLTTQIVYNTTQTQQAAAVASSNTTNTTVTNADGSTQQGSFTPLGTVQVNITDASGNAAATLSQALTVGLPLPDAAINPATGQPFTPGDEVPIFVLNEALNTWSEFTSASVAGKGGDEAVMGTVVSTAAGETIVWEITNPALTYLAGAFGGSTSLTLNLTGKSDENVRISASAVGYSVSRRTTASTIVVEGVPNVLVGQVSSATPLTVEVTFEGESVGSQSFTSLSADATLDVAVSIPETITAAVNISLNCGAVIDGKGVITPSTPFQYARKKGENSFVSPGSTGQLIEGKASIQVLRSSTYRASVTYEGETYSDTFETPATAPDGTFTVPVNLSDDQIRDVCNEF
ncbi:MAG: hypothetical protein RhofKO_21030 [Rhodothermales bacterium]